MTAKVSVLPKKTAFPVHLRQIIKQFTCRIPVITTKDDEKDGSTTSFNYEGNELRSVSFAPPADPNIADGHGSSDSKGKETNFK